MHKLLITLAIVFANAITPLVCDAANNAILISFTSEHCQHCQSMRPILGQLERDGVPLRRVDVGSEPEIARRYGIRKTPTFVIVSGGKEATRLVGAQTRQQLHQALQTGTSGPLFATNAKSDPSGGLSAPQTRLAPIGSARSNVSRSFQSRRTHSPNNHPAAPSYASQSNASPSAQLSESLPSLSLASAIERAQAATVRLRVHDGRGYGVGTGTIIDTHGEEALVLTCGHLFRETKGQGKIEVDLFVAGQTQTVAGQVLDYDADDRDVALVAIRPGFPVQAVPVISQNVQPRTGQTVFSFGCDRGADPSRRDTRITAVNKYNQHLGSSNLEIAVAPIDGRSGGGLFDDQGTLVGLCNAADYKNDVGIYAGPGNIHWQLDRAGLARLYQGSPQQPQAMVAAAPRQPAQPSFTGSQPSSSPASRGVSSPRGVAAGQGFPGVQQSPSGWEGSNNQEVIVIVRDRNQPNGLSKVMTLNQPSADLMNMIERHSR